MRGSTFGEGEREAALETAQVDNGPTVERTAAGIDHQVGADIGERVDALGHGGEVASEPDPVNGERK